MKQENNQTKKYKTTEAQRQAQQKYDEKDLARRRQQKRDYMRRKRSQNPNYCRWK